MARMYRNQQSYNSSGSTFGMQQGITPGIMYLLVANTAIFILQMAMPNAGLARTFGLVPYDITHRFTLWQPVSYMFLHGGFFHIFFNMLTLWMFGSDLERQWGTREFLKFYFIAGIGAGIITFLLTLNSTVPTIGASGAIFAVLVAFAVLYPNRVVYVWFLFPVKVKYLVMAMIGIGVFAAWSQSHDGIAHFTHLGGAAIGYLYLKQDWRLSFLRRLFSRWRFKRRVQVAAKQNRRSAGLMDEVDRILDRINEVGYENISEKEKKVLENASRQLSDKKD
ncbi:MAG: rhomboid family intramembrane serine protease [candidate division Zixibacteria bacterium]|nr:rhomboid family intramembrane serine protease [candidate division Zixibacteria bacterium]